VLPNVQFAPGANRYFTSGAPETFQAMLKRLIGVEAEVSQVTLEASNHAP
jgi:hypothetical protein